MAAGPSGVVPWERDVRESDAGADGKGFELLEIAGEAEEVVGAPVDFVLRPSLERSPNRLARDHILSTAVC
jgi:hypothetical protein